MQLYSDFPARRTAQIVADLVAVAILALAVTAAVLVHGLVIALADIGRQLEDAGSGFRDTMADAGDTLGGVPLIGDGIRGPFDAASEAGTTLADAGAAQQGFVTVLAWVLAVLIVLGPVAFLAWVWLRRRLRFARRAGEARTIARSEGGAELLALRALGRAPAQELLAAHPRPADAWRRGEPVAVAALAQLELRSAGVRAAL